MDTASYPTFAEKRAHHSPRGFAVVNAVPPLYSSPSTQHLTSKRQVPRSRWALFRSSFTTSSSSLPSSISEEQDTPSLGSASPRLKRSASSATPSLTIRRVLPSPPPKPSPYDNNSNNSNNGPSSYTTYQQRQQISRHASFHLSSSRRRDFKPAPTRENIEMHDLDSPRLFSPTETEPELVTAVRAQVFAPGSASMVSVAGRRHTSSAGRDAPSVTAVSAQQHHHHHHARTVKNVRSLPDLVGAAILLAQSGGRALTTSSHKANAAAATGEMQILGSGSVHDAETKRPRKLVRKRTLREKGSRDLLQVADI